MMKSLRFEFICFSILVDPLSPKTEITVLGENKPCPTNSPKTVISVLGEFVGHEIKA